MVVIQFREASDATEFIEEFNGKQFNSVEVSLLSPTKSVNDAANNVLARNV